MLDDKVSHVKADLNLYLYFNLKIRDAFEMHRIR